MPKKTRREKRLADLRRAAPVIQPTQYQFQPSAFKKVTVSPAQTTDAGDFAEIKRDLTKTLILAVTTIIVELIISWQLRA